MYSESQVAVFQEVDQVANMQGKGQYIYVHVVLARVGVLPGAEPVFKFNNGHHGGSSEVLFGEVCGGSNAKVFEKVLLPCIEKLLSEL